MAKYFTASRVKAAIQELSDTRAKAAFLDFLIVKRTLAIKGQTSVAITQGEAAYLQATRELAGAWNKPSIDVGADREIFNVFASRDTKHGYRSGKYISNGTGTTIGGNPWKTVIDFSSDTPRLISFKPGYESELPGLLLKSSAGQNKPDLLECAVWYYRRSDLETVVGIPTDHEEFAQRIRDQFVSDCGLNGAETTALFGNTLSAFLDGSVFASEVCEPQEYLPGLIRQHANLSGMVAAGDVQLKENGLQLSAGTLGRLTAALLTKRFLILTGLSGSGKTKLAHAFAAWIAETDEQYRVVAVGADWTTNENLLGYQDALRPEIYRKPTNGALELMLRARDDSERPYFLILDEMNLSHVERYFADMLSAIESGEPIALHSATEDLPGGDGDTVLVPPWLELPKNLFIVGTVNVDETTYMFSPKVLDRANVIEFRATADQIGDFLDNPQRIRMEALAGKGAGFGTAFVAAASGDAPSLAELPATIHDNGAQCAADLKARMVEAFKALAPIGAEFGFRTAFEISRFVAFHAVLTGPGWKFSDALDAQVYQKLMPKLHGSERRLGPVLKALEAFCTTHDCTASLEKIRRMQDRLKDGFTSYAEA
ncbi:MAG: DNA methyltransferase [Betaproteobacteria bacterium]|nr:DNA methyltransferase [Betaproteobacteria bacterium]